MTAQIMREVKRMTNKQAAALLEAIKIIAEKSADKSEVIQALTRIKRELNEKPASVKHTEASKRK